MGPSASVLPFPNATTAARCHPAWVNRKTEAHAVVRYDVYIADIADAISIVAVVPTRDEAEAEVERLTAVNADKGSRYFWVPTRYYPEGRGVSQV